MENNNYSYLQFMLFNCSTDKNTYTNTTGSTVTIKIGEILGTIASSNLLWPQVSTSTDGSQVPIGCSTANYSVPAGASQEITYVIAGEVDKNLVIFGGSDTFATDITDNSTKLGTIQNLLQGKGIILKGGTNLNYFDEQGS